MICLPHKLANWIVHEARALLVNLRNGNSTMLQYQDLSGNTECFADKGAFVADQERETHQYRSA